MSSLAPKEKIYYQDQTTWTSKDYNSLYFILNKAVSEEQDYLGKINVNLIANSTKALIKALIEYYDKPELYEKFPNLKPVKDQLPLSEIVILSNTGIRDKKFEALRLIN